MSEIITSAFDDLAGLTVEEMMSNPAFLPEMLIDSLAGDEMHKALFREVTEDAKLIGYRYDSADVLDDDVSLVAEFGEIPVSDPRAGELLTVPIEKRGVAIRVSWEQMTDDDRRGVIRELKARRNTILRGKARGALAALDTASKAGAVQTLAAGTAWNESGATPAENVLDAMELVMGAEDDNGVSFGYAPTVLVANPVTISALKRDETVAKLYTGDMAGENPLFAAAAAQPILFGQLKLIPSIHVPKSTVYVAQEGVVGFMAQREPEWVSDFYEERGNSGRGGATQAYRSDYAHRRAFAVDAPKAVVEITGALK